MIDRRQLLRDSGIAIASIGTTGLVLTGTDDASATVAMGELNMSGDQQTTTNGYISDVSATVSGSWSYELPGGEVDRWIVDLRVSDGNTWAVVGETSESNQYNQYNGEYEVSGSITDTELFDTEFFAAPGPGKQTSVELPFEVRFRVLDVNDTKLAHATATDTATVTVGQEAIDASLYGKVSGEGSVTIN